MINLKAQHIVGLRAKLRAGVVALAKQRDPRQCRFITSSLQRNSSITTYYYNIRSYTIGVACQRL